MAVVLDHTIRFRDQFMMTQQQKLAWEKELRPNPERVNPNGGAIALGHPLGCTGAKLTASIIREMKRRGSRYGMVTMCVGGGMGAAGIFENLN